MSYDTHPKLAERILGGLWGAIVGDAVGVPVEFQSREEIKQDPVSDLRGYGTHHQPPGTWSDDGSLLLCTVDSLLRHEFDVQHMGETFVRWLREGFWSAGGAVFDVGLGTADALDRIANGGLAGVYYGLDGIPKRWRNALARTDVVEEIFNRFTKLIVTHQVVTMEEIQAEVDDVRTRKAG